MLNEWYPYGINDINVSIVQDEFHAIWNDNTWSNMNCQSWKDMSIEDDYPDFPEMSWW